MDWISIVTTITTLFAGGGWFIYYKANKRKANGDAAQSEAEGWAKMQEVYQEHIKDMSEITQKVREERDTLFNENKELRQKCNELEEKILEIEKKYNKQLRDLRNEMARQGRKLEAILPFACGVAGCQNRKKVEIQDQSDTDVEEIITEN